MKSFRDLLLRTGVSMLMLGAVTAVAQERFGELYGSVLDASQAALPNATVTATNKDTQRALQTKTGTGGQYTFRDLEPGRYQIKIEATGFRVYEVPDVNLLVGKRFRVDATLQVGSTTETVQVTDQSPLIDFTNSAISHNVTAEEFDRLPKTRSFQNLALLSPSVNSGDIEGGFQINGASGAENQFNIDGVSTTSLINGKSKQNAMFEILQEVQVKTAGIDAEYGGALGGVVSAVTKSGGNNFHGDLHYYLSGNSLNASPVRRLLLDPATEKNVSFVQDKKQVNNNHEIGGSLGGRLIKDKLFFFSAFSPRYQRERRDYGFSSGAESGQLKRNTTTNMMFNKLSFDPTSRIRTFFTHLWTPTDSVGGLPAYSVGPNQVATSALANEVRKRTGYFTPKSSYTGQLDLSITNTSLLTLRAGRFWDNYKTTGIPGFSAIEWGNTSANYQDIPASLRQPAGFNNTPRLNNVFYDLSTRTYFQADFSVFAKFLGQHNFKAGIGTSKTVNKVDDSYPGGGYIRIFWNQTFPSPTLGPQRGTYGYYEANDFGTRGTTGGKINNFYFQDQWRVAPRLSLSLGVRLESEAIPSFRRDIRDNAFEFGYGDKIAPRLGATYDLFGDGRVKLYGGFYRSFDWVKYELSRGTFGGQVWKIKYRTLDTLDVFSLSGTNTPGRNIWAAAPDSVRDRRIPAFDLVGKDIKPMSQDQITGGMEFQIAPSLVFRAGYIHTNLRRTIEDLGALDAEGNEVYLYANPGEGQATIQPTSGATKPFPMPKAIRKYDAMELSLTRRFSKGYFASFSYVLSRLYGNYAGIASSDEITSPSTGLSSRDDGTPFGAIARQGGNANRAWDLDEILFDSHGNLDVKGRLATDRPHVFKLYGAKSFKFGTEIGLFVYAGSGTPLSTYVNTVNQIPIFVEGRGDMGRTPFFTQTDLNLQHDFKVREGHKLRVEFNMLNLFNQKTARNRFNNLNRGAGVPRAASAIDLHNNDLFKGFDYRAMLNATSDQRSGVGAYDPRYGLSDIFNPGFAGRLGIRYIF